jgi:predicted TIM-barrel fold metal-dependent hydrolase
VTGKGRRTRERTIIAGMLRELPIVDAHAHLWELGRLRYAWLSPPFGPDGPNGDVSPIARDYRVADYRAEVAGWNMVGMVHVQAGADDAQAVAETEWLQDQAAEHGLPTGIVAFAALDAPDLEATLAAHAAHPAVRGIRHIVNWHADPARTYTPRDVTRDEAWLAGYARLKVHGLSFDLQAYPGQFAPLASLIEQHPETPVIINHAGMGVDLDAGGRSEWRDGMASLAALPHVSVKLSGLGFVFRPWHRAAARDRVRETVDLFGPDRAMIASDMPTDRLFASLDETFGMLEEAIAPYTDDEQRALAGRTANRVYRLGLDL